MAKKTPKQVKPKTGLARCMELASNKKGLIFISAILSSLASIASFIPYIAVYFIIRSILQVYPNLNSLDVNEVIGYRKYFVVFFGDILFSSCGFWNIV